MNNVPKTPPEAGGILGAKQGTIVQAYLDKGLSKNKYCCYEPNTFLLNSVIQNWQKQNIDFVGIFHTHYYGVSTLSKNDISYINLILNSMPEEVENLYFPVVLPEQQTIIPYIAIKTVNGIKIFEEKIKIAKEK
ncbi:MAG: hypothetical protein ACI4HO_00765 [Ruminococcus sp.]